MLKLFLLFACALLAFSAPDDGCTDPQRKDFEAYKKEFKKNYASPTAEDQARKCFCKVDSQIKEHNANNKDYQQAHNKDSDGCNKVGSAYPTGLIFDEKKVGAAHPLPTDSKKVGLAPGAVVKNGGVDYSNLTSVVKDQGRCGCCWASSAASVLSYTNAVYGNKKVLDFSDQFFIDCVPQVNNVPNSCNGGNPVYVFQKGVDGIPLASTYPFKGVEGACQKFTSVFKCKKSAGGCPKGNEDTLKTMVDNYGPGVILMNVNGCPSFKLYKTGIFYDKACNATATTTVDHGVVVTGYGVEARTNTPYWIVKNSWGAAWGEGGYFRVRRNAGNQLNVAYCYYISCPPSVAGCT